MDLGTTLAIFIVVAVALLLSFCLLLKYYSYKIRKQRRQSINIDALDDLVYRSTEEIIEGAYQQFLQRRKLKKCNEMKQMSFQQDRLIQNSELRQVLDISNNIYGISKLRKNLNNQVPPLSLQTNRSLTTMKSFNISRLNAAQSDRQRAYFTYTHKIVSYTEQGLSILEVGAEAIKKVGVSYELVKQFEHSFIEGPSQEDFLDQLQAYGFFPLVFGYQKYIRSVDVTDVKQGQTYQLKAMKAHYKKETINKEQFQKLQEEMKSRKK